MRRALKKEFVLISWDPMNSFISRNLLLFLLILAWVLLALISYFLARRIARAFSRKWERWVYFALSFLPLKEALGMVFHESGFWRSGYFWFWVSYYFFCYTAFGYLTGRNRWEKLRRRE